MSKKPKSILIVEDERDIRESMQQILEYSGYEVYLASNGKEGMDFIGRQKPDLILLDLMMPVMNGWAFLESKGKNTDVAGIPVIISTAYGNRINGTADVKGIIRKPVDLNILLPMIEQSIEEPSSKPHPVE